MWLISMGEYMLSLSVSWEIQATNLAKQIVCKTDFCPKKKEKKKSHVALWWDLINEHAQLHIGLSQAMLLAARECRLVCVWVLLCECVLCLFVQTLGCVDEIYVKEPSACSKKYEYIHVLEQSIGAERKGVCVYVCLCVGAATLNTAPEQ